VIELGGLRAKTRLDISETLAKGQLRKGHRQVLTQTNEPLDLVISTVTRHTATKKSSAADAPSTAQTPACPYASITPAKRFIAGWQISGSNFKSRPAKSMSFLSRSVTY
jgi:hypothetical protein